MSRRPAPRLTPSLLVASLALLVACSGSAYAAGQAKGDALVKKASLSGNRLKNNTVTGKQVKEATLGKVKAAAKADRATTATSATTATTATSATTATTAGTAQSLPAPTVTPLALSTGWAAGGFDAAAPAYSKDLEGYVHLEGAVSNLTGGATIATLPPGFRPAGRIYLRTYMFGDTDGTVIISPSGAIDVSAGNDAYITLDNIVFRAGS